MKFAALAIAAAIAATPVNAQSTGADCAKIQASDQRLACYDGLFRSERSTTSSGAWQVSQEVSKISDVRNVSLTLSSNERIPGRFGPKDRATLVLTCREGKTDAYIIFGGLFMSSLNSGAVIYRVDKRPAVRKPMRESNDHQALGLWGGASAIPFIRELLDGSSVYVQATALRKRGDR